jgi:peptidoglycan/xylan/chitin deacetylase (PgdA/CDA1 family)
LKSPVPPDFDPRTVCLSVDVDWASAGVVADLRALFDARGLKATFFVTHAGIEVPGHERGLHPNFRRNGDVMRALAKEVEHGGEEEIYRRVVAAFKAFAPEAKGVRAHSLMYDSLLMPIYHQHGLEYDSSYQIPLVADLKPFWKEYDVLEIPIYFNDHFELKSGATGFDSRELKLEEPGLKVILLHPNMVFLNAASHEQYLAARPFHHDHDRLLAARHNGRGVRTMVTELLDAIVARNIPTLTLGEVNARWRDADRWQ